ncbi:glyoxylase-like metal-dependent hydrolase (beta-lactamase superfamily II) [Microbacterium sp. AK009]|uniref:MBL fold metallo-hydrolase n=1 Tax=Microbacterium sp. AK009 TaxID=2723068 RepID=UPI0015CD806D|nr:MBL fold metallo-hydrolase [Microbacterium sp. AK009]NYF16548.1 glyoxylase-like metal-dependent hydrolase (beta-lactamase superfamily II) [Microbacterium sp. AK009]
MIDTASPQTVEPVEVAPDIYRIDTPLGDRFASLYLVAGATSTLLYDTGVDGTIPAYVLPALARLGRTAAEVTTVVVSHCDVDHFGGVADARDVFPHARIVAGEADVPLIENFDRYLADRAREFREPYGWDEDPAVLAWCRDVTRETRLDGPAADGEWIDLGGRVVQIVAVPGHTRGHLAVDVKSADAVLVGDAVLGASVKHADGTTAFPPTYRYVDDYLTTIARLEEKNRELLLTAHYPTMRGTDASKFLAVSRRFAERLDQQVLEVLTAATDGLTFAELLSLLNPSVGDWPVDGTEGALAFPVAGHLERHLVAGRIRRTGARGGVAVWATA